MNTMAQRISIGFHSSPPLALRVSDKELAKLNDALGGEGWHDITADDGSVNSIATRLGIWRAKPSRMTAGSAPGGA